MMISPEFFLMEYENADYFELLKLKNELVQNITDFENDCDMKNDGWNINPGPRQVQYISIEEIAKGMLLVIDNNIGLTKDDLLHETSRAFGFSRIGNNIIDRMLEAFDYLETHEIISVIDEKVIKN